MEEKVALVTGGASGFGEGIVRRLVSSGASVLIVDVNETAAESLVAGLPSGRTSYVSGDVSSEETWKKALDQCLSTFGRLDVVVNNAGVLHDAKPATEISEDEFDRLFRINVKSLFWSTKVLIPYFRDNEVSGSFINISSTGAIRPRPNLVWYSATKGAVTIATKALAAEWAKHSLRFNAVCPSVGNTAMMSSFLAQDSSKQAQDNMLSSIPLGRVCEASDVANVVNFLASDASAYITGVNLEVDGGRCI